MDNPQATETTPIEKNQSVEQSTTQAATPVKAVVDYPTEYPQEQKKGGIRPLPFIVMLLMLLAVGGVIYAASVHVKASKKHLENEKMVAAMLEEGKLEIKTEA